MWMRVVGAVAVLVSAAVHLWLWFDGFRDLRIIGPSFLLNAAAGAVIAVLLLVWRSWVPGFLAAGFGVCTLGAFIVSSTVGLFGLHEQWVGWSVWTATASEVVAIVAGTLVLVRDLPARSGGQLQHGSSVRRADLH
jgi:hypothetical protein